jgi:F-type H+-transporting ATPase subunit delta
LAQNSVLEHIARPYASALFDLAAEGKTIAATEKSVDAIVKLLGQSDDFSRFLASPVLSADVKASTIDAILAKSKTPPLVEKFIKLVAQNGRLFALPTILRAFKELAAKERGEVTADVTSATPLSKEQLKTLSDTLKKKIGKTVTLNAHVDSSLIGGLQVKVGSQMIDSSLKTKLTAMKIAMKEVG